MLMPVVVVLLLVTDRVAIRVGIASLLSFSAGVMGVGYAYRDLTVPLYETDGRTLRLRRRKHGKLMELAVPSGVRVQATQSFLKITSDEPWLWDAPPGTVLDGGGR